MDPVRQDYSRQAVRRGPPVAGARTAPLPATPPSVGPRRAYHDAVTPDGETAVMMAAKEGNGDAIRFLVHMGAELDVWDKSGCTALMRAAERGHAQCTAEMLAMGANADATDKDGVTALMKAASRRKLQCVKVLLAEGDPWAVDKAGLSARDHADRRGFWEIVAELDRATKASGNESSYCCSEQLSHPRSPKERCESSEPAANRTLVFGDGEPDSLDESMQSASDRAARKPLTLGELGAAAPSTTVASSPCSTTASSAATRIFEDATPLVNFSGDAVLSVGKELRVEQHKR